ncbi:MAG TPA: ribosome biogenesis GTPase Der [Terriglobia bacterium]|nr:ribosome biogenesis GTPase Der [Terriglobia bacterium]
MPSLPRIVILGRPNVGKSTLFNRLCKQRRALVGNEPGMTRDRLYACAEWLGMPFEVIDTGGIIPSDKELIPIEIYRQAKVAIEEAAHLILMVDGREGVVPLDEELAQLLRRTGKPLTVAVNKVDAEQHLPLAGEFHRLGIKHIFPISAEHGRGLDDLLDHVTAGFAHHAIVEVESPQRRKRDRSVPPGPPEPEAEDVSPQGELPAHPITRSPDRPIHDHPIPGSPDHPINVAIIGRPNVGKSTLLNKLLDEERSIVSSVPGTTRDAVDAELERDGRHYRFVDTAGIRRKGKTKLLAEKLSVIQARKHLERADVALLILDAQDGVNALDTHIGGYAHESRRSVIIVVNKWDAIKKGPTTTQDFTQEIRERMKYLDYAPIVFISALRGQRLGNLLQAIAQVAEARQLRVSTAEMNRFLAEVDFERASSPSGKPTRLYYLTQAGVAPPIFVAFTNRSGKLHFSFERFLENRIRERFGFLGTPIVIKSRARR